MMAFDPETLFDRPVGAVLAARRPDRHEVGRLLPERARVGAPPETSR